MGMGELSKRKKRKRAQKLNPGSDEEAIMMGNNKGRSPIHNNQQQPATDLGSARNGYTQHTVRVKAGEVLTGSLLKHLYDHLVKLSPNENFQQDGYGGAISMCVSIQGFIMEITYPDIIDLSTLLFEELHKQFEQLVRGASYLPSVVVSDENGCLTSDSKFSPEEFLLLIRCSMIIVQFLEFDLTLVLERCQILVALLGKLCPLDSTLQFSNQFAHGVDVVTPEDGRSANFLFAILEVFLDEFLMHHELRKHFIMTDCASAMKEKLFLSHCSHDDVQAIMELVSSHFLLSLHDELAFVRFVHSLSWSNEVHNQIPAVGLDSALSLLGYPVIFSAPHLLQAHLIVLASRCIGIHMPGDAKKLDMLVMNHYILAFELSVKLYSGFMPILSFFGSIIGDERESSFAASELSFDSCIRSLTCDKLRQQTDSLINFCHTPSLGLQSGSKEEILDSSIAYIKENQSVIDVKFRDEACSILTCIVESILPGESELLHEDGESIQQEIYCVAAVLKLMSSSLLQILWFLRSNGSLGGMKTSKEFLVCREYKFISGIISYFRDFSVDQHIQKILFGIATTTGGHTDIRLMFSHFASLLSYSFRKKLDFLWKGCIFMMISLVNILIFEEGNLDAFLPLLCERKGPTFSYASQTKNLKDLVHKPSSITIASNLKKVRNRIKYLACEDHRMGSGKITEMETRDGESNASNVLPTNATEKHDIFTNETNACSGEIFLNCLPGFRNKHSDWDDLVDFIECDHRKDYSNWLVKRARYRKWKHKRISSIKHKFKSSRRKKLRDPCKILDTSTGVSGARKLGGCLT